MPELDNSQATKSENVESNVNKLKSADSSPVILKRGRLNLTPISADSSWYSGVAAVTAKTMPRAFWQPIADSHVPLLESSASIPQTLLSKPSPSPAEDPKSVRRSRPRKSSASSSSSTSSTSTASSSSSERKAKRKQKEKKEIKKRKNRRHRSTSSSETSTSTEKNRRRKIKEKVDEFEASKYYSSKHPRSGHSQSVVSPDTTAVRSREKSTTPSVGKPSVGTQKIQGVETSSSCKMEVAKCPYCINTNVQSKDLEAHMVLEHCNARFGCCLCNSDVNDDDDVVGLSSDEEGCRLALRLNCKQRAQFDTYSQARAHLVQVHQINAAVEGEDGNDDVADQLMSVPYTAYLRTYTCTWCSAQFIGLSEDNLRLHFKKVHNTPLFMPQFLKRNCRICGFSESKTDAELTKHIDLTHPRSRFWKDEKAEAEPGEVVNASIAESGELVGSVSSVSVADKTKKEAVSDIITKKKKLEALSVRQKEDNEVMVLDSIKSATVDASKKSKKKKRKSKNSDSDSSEQSSESSSDQETKKKIRKRKKSSKKKKKSKKKSKKEESSEESEESSQSEEQRDSLKDAINFFITKKPQSIQRRDSILQVLENKNGSRPRKEKSESEEEIPVIRVEPLKKVEQRSESEKSRSRSRSHYRRSKSESEDEKRRPQYRSKRSDVSDSEEERRVRSIHRTKRSDDSDSDRENHRCTRGDDELSNNIRGGFCDDCNLPLAVGKVKDHFNSTMHHSRTKGKMRCFLCNKHMQNARQHLEMNHQDDIFRCNVKQCICPKFVEARKILDHLERTHSSVTQGKTTEQLIRGGFLILPKNLEVHSCYYCNISFAGQPIDRVYTHMQDRCGIRSPMQSDVVFSCRFCGPRRVFETQAQLDKHCLIHLESVRESKNNVSSIVKGRSESPSQRSRSRPAPRERERISRSNSRSSASKSPSRPRHTSRRRSTSSERSQRSISPPKFNCFYCSFTSGSKPNREHHIFEQHATLLFTCKVCESNPFKSVNRFDMYDHLNEKHSKTGDEEELDKLIFRPHDLRKIICLECGEMVSLENAQWLCKDPHEVSGELKEHLLSLHKPKKIVSNSFGLRCISCAEEFDYDDVDQWTDHVRKGHSRSQDLRPARPASPVLPRASVAPKRCDYCSKMNTPGHVLAEHSEVAFRCKTCSLDDEKNCFASLPDVRRHCIQVHAVCDFTARLTQLIIIPSNLVCLKCKFCCDHLYAQTLEDIQNHFKTEHASVKNFGKHLDFLCRLCMQCDTHETWNDLKLHLSEEHATKFGDDCDVAKSEAISQQRDEEKETSPDVSCSVFDIVRPLIDSLIESSILPSN